jgi:hypothetical protein
MFTRLGDLQLISGDDVGLRGGHEIRLPEHAGKRVAFADNAVDRYDARRLLSEVIAFQLELVSTSRQLDLFHNYLTNVALYPAWQRFLRARPPKTLIFWASIDIFSTPEGGEAYLHDLPEAELHRLESGHFAVEDCLETIAGKMRRLYDEKVAVARVTRRTA